MPSQVIHNNVKNSANHEESFSLILLNPSVTVMNYPIQILVPLNALVERRNNLRVH